MVANVSPLSVLQNSPSTHQSNAAGAGNGGASFANMLSSEMHSQTTNTPPAPPPSPPPAATATPTPAASSTPAPASSTGTSTTAAGSTGGPGKKTGKTAQTASDAQTTDAQSAASAASAAATAATAAALAAAASNPDLNKTTADSSAAGSVTAASAASTAAASAATTTTDQFSALASSVAANAASGQAHDASAKAPFGVSLAAAGNGTGKAAAAAPVITQNAVVATAASLRSAAGKFSGQAPSELTAQPGKVMNPEAANSKAALEPATQTAASGPTVPAAGSTALADITAPVVANPIQNMKAAGQDLSIQQQNAIAPVLTAPANLETPAASSIIAPQVGSPAWDQAVGQKINWMVSGGQQTASLTLNPPDLGPMQVVLSVNNQHASATFISHQPEVRAALENAIPKLREMMEQSGIQLGQCNVNSQTQQQASQQQQSNTRSGSSAVNGIGATTGSVMASEPSTITRTGTGLVDTFV